MKVLCLLLLPLLASATESLEEKSMPMKCAAYPYPFTATVCEHKDLRLSCLSGNVIHVIDAFYGRQHPTVCGQNSRIDCLAENSLEKIREKCEGKTSCKLTSTNDEFGDPCFGVPKYIKMIFKCVPPKRLKPRLGLACEHQKPVKISCPEGQKIVVTKAMYGRDEEHSCPGNVYSTLCYAEGSSEKIKDQCHKKSHCILEASNDKYGDPCPKTKKLLKMEYFCVKESDLLLPINRTICESEYKTEVRCPIGKVMLLDDGFYGRVDKMACSGRPHFTDKCKAGDSEMILRARCDSRQRCSLRPSNSVFGDPCPLVKKYIRMRYYCVTPISRHHMDDILH